MPSHIHLDGTSGQKLPAVAECLIPLCIVCSAVIIHVLYIAVNASGVHSFVNEFFSGELRSVLKISTNVCRTDYSNPDECL